jgi:hypothetical protein
VLRDPLAVADIFARLSPARDRRPRLPPDDAARIVGIIYVTLSAYGVPDRK